MAIARAFNVKGGTVPESMISGSEITENLSNQINGQKSSFTTTLRFVEGRIRVYYNGSRLAEGLDFFEAEDRSSISLSPSPLYGELLVVDYEVD